MANKYKYAKNLKRISVYVGYGKAGQLIIDALNTQAKKREMKPSALVLFLIKSHLKLD